MDKLSVMQDVLTLEAQALERARQGLTAEQVDRLSGVFDYLHRVSGCLVFCGVGKSGHIGVKLASTFASLGLNSWFLHPTEALHGDLGRLKKGDAIVFLSKSGTTEEICRMIPYIDVEKQMRIGLLGNTDSPIANECGIVFDCSVEKEACINNRAPTTSSTLALAMGDAMAVFYEHQVGLSKEGFAANHPGGLLGKSLRMKVEHLMWKRGEVPTLKTGHTLKDVILEMTNKPVGGCAVLDDTGKLLGIMVEGDIRRTFTTKNQGIETPVENVMTTGPVTIGPDDLAYEALKAMEMRTKQIDILPVVNNENVFLGFIRLHDLLKEGFTLG